MKFEVRVITPDVATVILGGNVGNRKIRKSAVDFYALEMKSGNWQTTHQGISVSKSGKLLDGQHRLLAVIKSGVSVEMLVVSECEDKVFNMLDVGACRTALDTVGVGRKAAGLVSGLLGCIDGTKSSSGKIQHSTIKKFNDTFIDRIREIDANSGVRGLTGKVLVGAFVYLQEGGDIEKLRCIRRFIRYGTASGCTNAILFACSKLLKNENRFTSTVEAPILVYKAMAADASAKIVRVTEQDKTDFSEKCKKYLADAVG